MEPVSVAVRLFGEMMDEQIAVLTRVLEVLRTLGARHALVGGHAVSAHTRPRLTVDVDLLIEARRRTAIEGGCANAGFTVRSRRDVLQLFESPDAATSVADLLLDDSNPAWTEALRTAVEGSYQGQAVPVATPAALIAMKFVAATSVSRPQEERLVDVSDISRLARLGWTHAVATEARRIAELSHAGAGAQLDQLVADLLAGRPVTV